MVREGEDVYYRSVHLFVERVKNAILTKGEELVRINLNTRLRGTALVWYTGELSELERLALRSINGQWVEMLQKRFRPNNSAALTALINERFTVAHVRNGREPSSYVRSMGQ